MLHKILILALLSWLVFRVYQYIKNSKSAIKPTTNNPEEDMVSCETCQVFLPAKDAIRNEGNFYCSPGHVPKIP